MRGREYHGVAAHFQRKQTVGRGGLSDDGEVLLGHNEHDNHVIGHYVPEEPELCRLANPCRRQRWVTSL
jgi:hypothetical protein